MLGFQWRWSWPHKIYRCFEWRDSASGCLLNSHICCRFFRWQRATLKFSIVIRRIARNMHVLYRSTCSNSKEIRCAMYIALRFTTAAPPTLYPHAFIKPQGGLHCYDDNAYSCDIVHPFILIYVYMSVHAYIIFCMFTCLYLYVCCWCVVLRHRSSFYFNLCVYVGTCIYYILYVYVFASLGMLLMYVYGNLYRQISTSMYSCIPLLSSIWICVWAYLHSHTYIRIYI